MRFLIALALTAVLCTPLAAQTQYADSTGAFVSVRDFAIGVENRYALDAVVGRRFARGVDAGLRVQHAQRGDVFGPVGVRSSIGPVAGLTRPLGAGISARIEAAALYTYRRSTIYHFLEETNQNVDVTLTDHDLAGDAVATVSRSFRLAGSVHARPTVGLYGDVEVFVDRSQSPQAVPGFTAASRSIGPYTEGGLHLELPLSFRVFGKDAAVVPHTRVRLAGGFGGSAFDGRSLAYAGGGLHLNL